MELAITLLLATMLAAALDHHTAWSCRACSVLYSALVWAVGAVLLFNLFLTIYDLISL